MEYNYPWLDQNIFKLTSFQLPTTVEIPRSFPDMFPLENGRHHLTAYFTNPAKICNGAKRTMGCVGENLYIQNGSNPRVLYKVPLRESGMRGTKWTKGKCFYQMGKRTMK